MKLDKKRKLKRKTNYKKRLKLLKGGLNRFVVRKTNRYLIMQIIESNDAQDKVLISVNTKELLKYGWPENNKGSLKSISAGYLGGFLLGKKSKNIKEAILDSGLHPNTKESKIYAAVKGLSDSGVGINFKEEVVPKENKIKGEFTKISEEDFDNVKKKIGENLGGQNG